MPDSATPDDPAEVVARPAEFTQLDPRTGGQPGGSSLDTLRDVPLTVTAQLGHAVLTIADVLKLGPGAVVSLEEGIDQPVQLSVRGVPFAAGEVVVMDGHFAVRIKSLLPPRGGRPTG